MRIRSILLPVVIGVLPLVIAGCKPSTSIRGSVTYDGQVVKKGSISFVPEDGRGPTAGSQIADGAYQVKTIVPGKKVVRVISVREGDIPHSTEELAQRAQKVKQSGGLAFNIVDGVPPGCGRQ